MEEHRMSEPVKLLTPEQAVIDEKARLERLANPKTETDRSVYERCLAIYRQICMDIRQLLNLPTFRGGFDEWAAIAMDDSLADNSQLQILSRRGESINALITYEAKKLGIVPPNWWKECWADELDAEASQHPTTDS